LAYHTVKEIAKSPEKKCTNGSASPKRKFTPARKLPNGRVLPPFLIPNVKKGNTTTSSVTLPGPSSDDPVVVNINQSQQATPGAVGKSAQPKGLTAAGDNTTGSNNDSSGDHSLIHDGCEDKSPTPKLCIMLTPAEESQPILNRSPVCKVHRSPACVDQQFMLMLCFIICLSCSPVSHMSSFVTCSLCLSGAQLVEGDSVHPSTIFSVANCILRLRSRYSLISSHHIVILSLSIMNHNYPSTIFSVANCIMWLRSSPPLFFTIQPLKFCISPRGQGRVFRFTHTQSTQLLGGIIQALSLSVCRPH
jgi:hypothetical protein